MTATLSGPSTGSLAASKRAGARKAKDRTATALVTLCFLIALVPLVWLLWSVISKGIHAVTRNGWFTHSQANITYKDPGGGVYHAVVGTLEQVVLCSVISIPIALLVAVYLVEYGRGPLAKVTTFMVDILTGVPSIVAALFIYAVFITTFHLQPAGWLVSLALVMLMIPVIVRTTEEMLKLVPNELREAAYALGVPKWRTITSVVLPTAMSGIVTGVVLGIARVAGETAPLIILVGYSQYINGDLFSGNQASLPGMIRDQVANIGNTQAFVNGHVVKIHWASDRMWGTALTLIAIVMILNIIARLIARRSKVAN